MGDGGAAEESGQFLKGQMWRFFEEIEQVIAHGAR